MHPPADGQPVALSFELPTGPLKVELYDVRNSGALTVTLMVSTPLGIPSDYKMMGFHYLAESADLDFDAATLQFAYRDVDILGVSASEPPLRLLHFENGRWRDITSGLDRDNRQIMGRTNTLSLFAIVINPQTNFIYLPHVQSYAP